ncbi:MAG: nucleotidyltransferase family protein [Candidatus Manganitrophus sp. SA1]|nr:nucleotidyltransferase family protein [Candidatus Manganitrophus morganii]
MAHPNLNLPLREIGLLCKRHHVRELALFGSALSNDFGPESDVDFLVEFEKGASIGFLEFAALQNALSDLLHRKVDLVPKKGLKPLIRDEVLSRMQVIHAA